MAVGEFEQSAWPTSNTDFSSHILPDLQNEQQAEGRCNRFPMAVRRQSFTAQAVGGPVAHGNLLRRRVSSPLVLQTHQQATRRNISSISQEMIREMGGPLRLNDTTQGAFPLLPLANNNPGANSKTNMLPNQPAPQNPSFNRGVIPDDLANLLVSESLLDVEADLMSHIIQENFPTSGPRQLSTPQPTLDDIAILLGISDPSPSAVQELLSPLSTATSSTTSTRRLSDTSSASEGDWNEKQPSPTNIAFQPLSWHGCSPSTNTNTTKISFHSIDSPDAILLQELYGPTGVLLNSNSNKQFTDGQKVGTLAHGNKPLRRHSASASTWQAYRRQSMAPSSDMLLDVIAEADHHDVPQVKNAFDQFQQQLFGCAL
eukprot:comp6181_c0_seq1/m.2014 comp6181_c0_seq1/g.2014  ORF comp6181_c0_seq1/g.2014 comp6181_c0_seq1/m.2014 type:complete len:372 (-) comp6181_c0_seq1:385-1500(-)